MAFEWQPAILHMRIVIERLNSLILQTTSAFNIESVSLRPLVQIVITARFFHRLVNHVDQLRGAFFSTGLETLQVFETGKFSLLQSDLQAMFVVRLASLVRITKGVSFSLVKQDVALLKMD